MPKLPIYLDHHATTPTDPRVVEAMIPYFSERFGNAASRHHAFGWAARDAVEAARRQIARLIECDPRELFFTSGATESNNLALKGVLAACHSGAPHVVTVATEHRAVLDPCRRLEKHGVRLTVLKPEARRALGPARYRACVDERHGAAERDGGEQRARRPTAAARDRGVGSRPRNPVSHGRSPSGRQGAVLGGRCWGRSCIHQRAQDLRPKGGRGALRAPSSSPPRA